LGWNLKKNKLKLKTHKENSMEKRYLCYDLKGIQSYIFKIPKLKYIIGGSALVDQFDKDTVKNISLKGAQFVFSGGGKGAFFVDKNAIQELKDILITEAHNVGLDICFGENESFSQASQQADELYSFVPKLNAGFPCSVSGLYPVKDGKSHPVMKKRIYQRREKIFRRFEERLIKDINISGFANDDLSFFHDVKQSNGDEGDAGFESLGDINRWAIIAMDGNDMGMQFRHQVSNENPNKLSEEELLNWIVKMSNALDNCSTQATLEGIKKVINEWGESSKGKEIIERELRHKQDNDEVDLVLPIRPLVVGGDDIIVLCNTQYAMTFVKEASRIFEITSQKTPKLWPATNGNVTISAGILFTPSSLPLHMAIPYTEALLASAKNKGRNNKKNEPSDACVDWEHITNTVIDTPAAKRQKECLFFDEDLKRKVVLTNKPYTFNDYEQVELIALRYKEHVPNNIQHKVIKALYAPYADRLGFYAAIKKQPKQHIYNDLNEFEEDSLGDCWTLSQQKEKQSTSVIDALLLLEEGAISTEGEV